jgi:hypothetical protein
VKHLTRFTSAERLRLDGLWQALGVDRPRDGVAQLIEATLVAATLKEVREGFADLERQQATRAGAKDGSKKR